METGLMIIAYIFQNPLAFSLIFSVIIGLVMGGGSLKDELVRYPKRFVLSLCVSFVILFPLSTLYNIYYSAFIEKYGENPPLSSDEPETDINIVPTEETGISATIVPTEEAEISPGIVYSAEAEISPGIVSTAEAEISPGIVSTEEPAMNTSTVPDEKVQTSVSTMNNEKTDSDDASFASTDKSDVSKNDSNELSLPESNVIHYKTDDSVSSITINNKTGEQWDALAIIRSKGQVPMTILKAGDKETFDPKRVVKENVRYDIAIKIHKDEVVTEDSEPFDVYVPNLYLTNHPYLDIGKDGDYYFFEFEEHGRKKSSFGYSYFDESVRRYANTAIDIREIPNYAKGEILNIRYQPGNIITLAGVAYSFENATVNYWYIVGTTEGHNFIPADETKLNRVKEEALIVFENENKTYVKTQSSKETADADLSKMILDDIVEIKDNESNEIVQNQVTNYNYAEYNQETEAFGYYDSQTVYNDDYASYNYSRYEQVNENYQDDDSYQETVDYDYGELERIVVGPHFVPLGAGPRDFVDQQIELEEEYLEEEIEYVLE